MQIFFLNFSFDLDVTDKIAKSSDFQPNGLTRSRRSHFSHNDSALDTSKDAAAKKVTDVHISYEHDRLVYFSKSPHSWQLPHDWLKICELYPNIIRNKVRDVLVHDESNNNNVINGNKNNNNNINNIDITNKATASNQTANAANNNMFRRRGVATSQ